MYDKRRRRAKTYKKGDIVVIEKFEPSEYRSRKMVPPFSRRLVVDQVLQNDRYVVKDLPGNTNNKRRYERVVAVDRMKPWVPPSGLSDSSDGDIH